SCCLSPSPASRRESWSRRQFSIRDSGTESVRMAIKLEPNARSIAAHVIDRVYTESAFAAAVLDAALERYPELDPRERALSTELAYGTLRTGPYLEKRLAKHAPRGTK